MALTDRRLIWVKAVLTRPGDAARARFTTDQGAIMKARQLMTALQGIALAILFASPAMAEPLVPKKLYFTTISVPPDCVEPAKQDAGIWGCTLALGENASLKVQLDEMLVPMEQVSRPPWTEDDVVAVLTGQFFINWMKGAVARTPDNATHWEVVPDTTLPRGMAACNDYLFERRDAYRRLHFVEQGRFCVLTRHPVQWPYILVASVTLGRSRDDGSAFPADWTARAEAILSTFRLAAP
jgi:hypothetical protein